MFTGIVERTGKVKAITRTTNGVRLTIATRGMGDLKRGESLAINGACLTVVQLRRAKSVQQISFDVLKETLRLTNLQFLETGGLVNLERPLRASDRLSGHFVLGHVDGLGKITRWEKVGKDWLLEIAPPKEVAPSLIYKGSIAIDGISLTVAKVSAKTFQVWIIPHTHEVTNLQGRSVGEFVNLEADVLGKYAKAFLKK